MFKRETIEKLVADQLYEARRMELDACASVDNARCKLKQAEATLEYHQRRIQSLERRQVERLLDQEKVAT